MNTILDVNNLSYYYQDGEAKRFILKNITKTFERGKFYTILGESGSGKTTFLALISALDEAQQGSIKYDGQDIKKIGFEKYRRNKIGIVFQQYNLIPYMTALENVTVAMGITDNKLPKDLQETAFNLLNYVGIDRDRAKRNVRKLSGGEQQRVAIARATATDVDLILADEPTGNLDEEKQAEVVEIFKNLAHKHNKCVIVVTHSLDVSQQSDVCLKLRNGVFENNG